MQSRILTVTFALCALAAISSNATADTKYVDQRYGSGGDGTANAPYNTIQAAINDKNSTTIIVYPGTYGERLSIDKGLTILAYDGPLTTRLNAAAGGDAVTITRGMVVTLQGLTISSGNRGIVQPTQGILYLRNCIFCGNVSHGIYVERTETANVPDVYIDNCICVANGGSGLYIFVTYYTDWYKFAQLPNVRAFNNILIGNQAYGIGSNFDGSATHIGSGGEVMLDYNDYVGNVAGNYSNLFGSGNLVSAGVHSFSIAPAFVGGSTEPCTQDFRLVPPSACKDAGSPGLGWQDPDGTRNDIGAYGGPGAQNFYTNPNDGPMIRSVTIDQGMVPRGSTFTIRATGAVR
jgi:hypothetical protein